MLHFDWLVVDGRYAAAECLAFNAGAHAVVSSAGMRQAAEQNAHGRAAAKTLPGIALLVPIWH